VRVFRAMNDVPAPAAPPSSASTKTSLPANVKLLSATSLLNDVASEMIYPLMPQFLLTVLGGNRFDLGIIEGVADSVSSLLKLWAGAWSDRAGRRKTFVLVGYVIAATMRPLVGLVVAPWQLFAVRTADRIGKGIRTAPRDALIADSTDPSIRGRAFGFHRAMDHVGAAVGPLLATAFLWYFPDRLRLLFLLTIVPGIAVVSLLALGLKEPAPSGERREPLRLSLRPFDRNFRLYLAALVVFTLGNSSDAFLLVRAQELGVPTWALPLLWVAFHVVKSAGNILFGRVVDRVGPRPLIFGGWAVYAAIYLAFAWATTAWQIWVFFLLYGVFYALTEPAEKTLVSQLVGAERRGLAFGWFNFAIGIAALPSSMLFGWLYQNYGAFAAFGTGAALAAVAATMLLGVRMPDRNTEPDRDGPALGNASTP
jgi:MFS family permease